MKPTAERLAELSQAIRAAEQHQKAHDQTLNRYHANYLIALLLCYEAELKTRGERITAIVAEAFEAGANHQSTVDDLGIYGDDYGESLRNATLKILAKHN